MMIEEHNTNRTPSEEQEALGKLFGTGRWEQGPTVSMELTEPRVKSILAGMEDRLEVSTALMQELKTRIEHLETKKTPSERQEALTKLLGKGWEKGPTVSTELTEPRVKSILAGMETKDSTGKASAVERIRGGGASTTYESLKMPTALRDEIAQTNSYCFSHKLEKSVKKVYEQWLSGGIQHYGKLPTYEQLGGQNASDELLAYVQCALRYRLISDMQSEFAGSVHVSESLLQTFKSESRGLKIDVEAVAQAALGAMGIRHAALASVLKAVLSSNGKNEFVLTNEANETFKAQNTQPRMNCTTTDSADDRIMRSYSGVLVTSSRFAADMFCLAGLSKRQKCMGVRAVGVEYDALSVIFPDVAKEFEHHSMVLACYHYWLVKQKDILAAIMDNL